MWGRQMQSLYISRVVIKNFRNFMDVDVKLGHKQVIIGENNIGKTNFLRALQLILDPTLSDEDRMLQETDFNEQIKNPMENKEEILIQIYIDNYAENKTILTVFQDATVRSIDGKELLLFTYRFYPYTDENGNVEYQYNIYKANDETRKFGSYERKYLNLKVIKALRDVEGEIRNSRTSPIQKMLKDYSIDKSKLEYIANAYKEGSKEILNLDELIDLTSNINHRFGTILGNDEFNVSLQAMEINPSRVLSSLKLLMAQRNTSDISLGINNILYISIVLQMLQDKTVPTLLKAEKYEELLSLEDSKILKLAYEQTQKGNYFLKRDLSNDMQTELYHFMDKYMPVSKGVTILAIEEPEAHLHPVNQRLIYKDVIQNSNNSVLLTTHSTHIKGDERIYHTMYDEGNKATFGYLGMEIVERMVDELKLNGDNEIPKDVNKADDLYRSLGIFVGTYTFEVDMMENAANTERAAKAHKVLVDLFNELTTGGSTQKSNFKKEMANGDYWKCLSKIEGNGIGKGRFSQRLVSVCMEEHIPDYVRMAIEHIYTKVSKK